MYSKRARRGNANGRVPEREREFNRKGGTSGKFQKFSHTGGGNRETEKEREKWVNELLIA